MAVACLLAATNASVVLQRWIELGSDWKNPARWEAVMFYQVLSVLGPVLAGPISMMSGDLYRAILKMDPTGGLGPVVLSANGINGGDDLFQQTWDYGISLAIKKLKLPQELSPDLTGNFVNKLA